MENVISLFILLINIIPNYSQRSCINLNVYVKQDIEGSGFHRNIQWSIELPDFNKDSWLNGSCQLALMVTIPKGLYVYPEQVEDLQRSGKLNILQTDDVDVEAVAHESNTNTAFIYLNNLELSKINNLTLPIHLRYHRSLIGGFDRVIFKKFNLLGYCVESNDLICGKKHYIYAPQTHKNLTLKTEWKNITYNSDFGNVEFLVPIGDLNHYPFVATITYVFGCAGCIYIISALSKINPKI